MFSSSLGNGIAVNVTDSIEPRFCWIALRSYALSVPNDVRVVVQGDLGILVAHQLRYDVDWGTGLQQPARYPVPEAMNPDMDSLRP